jgi:hypothetical protein
VIRAITTRGAQGEDVKAMLRCEFNKTPVRRSPRQRSGAGARNATMRCSLHHALRLLALAPFVVCTSLCACSSSSSPSTGQDAGGGEAGGGQDSGKDCSASETAIVNAATRRGLDPDTVCASTEASVMQDFAAACAELKACEAR